MSLDFRGEIPMLSPVIQPMTKGRRCALCNKGPIRGEQITRRGLAKAKGGVGRKITGRSKRSFKPNLQRVRAIVDGKTVRLKVCTSCLRLGRVQKPA
jgi:large subunit ribosomal protein L28